MNEHSPTPWRVTVNPLNGGVLIKDCCPGVSSTVGNMFSRANAEFVVEAVNERDRLREERDAALAHASDCERDAAAERAARARAVEEAQREANQRADRLADLVRRTRLIVKDANEFATSMASMFPEVGDRGAWRAMESILREALAEDKQGGDGKC